MAEPARMKFIGPFGTEVILVDDAQADVEVQVMAVCLTALRQVDGTTQGRIIGWLSERFPEALTAPSEVDRG